MLTFGFIVVLVLVIGLTTTRRMVMVKSTPWLLWPVLGLAMLVPPVIAWTALFPGDVVSSAEVEALNDKVEIDVPEGHALLVTGDLVPLTEVELEDEGFRKTNYALKMVGHRWGQTVSGEVKRTGQSQDLPTVNDYGGGEARGKSKVQVVWLGENLQDRHRLDGTGTVKVSVARWKGRAARRLVLEVVPDTPADLWLYGIVGVLGSLAILCDVKFGTDRLAADVGFLTFTGPFIAQGITPAGGLASAFFQFALALVVGGLSFRIIGAVAEKMFRKQA